MKLIKKLIEQQKLAEDAAGGAVGAGAVAGFSTPLFASLSKRDLPKKIRITKIKKEKKPRGKGLGIGEAFYTLAETDNQATMAGGETFDTTEVVAKLKSLENKETVNNTDTQAFALEDDDGNLVKVRVRAEQGPNFEAALNAFLSQHEDDEEQRGVPEIAEILFKLKDRFDIVDVEWPEVPEDQEEAVDVAGGQPEAEGQPPAEGAEGAEGQPPAEGDLAALGGEPGAEGGDLAGLEGGAEAGEGEVKSLLTQVIDMMKADAEARKAEAHARSSEAKAREAELATQQVYAKVKQEEQFLDMETDQKKQKEAEKEAKRLAQLARWKHDMEAEDGASFDQTGGPTDVGSDTAGMPGMGQPEDEEAAFMRRVHQPRMRAPSPTAAQHATKKPRLGGRVAPHDVASYILSRVK